MSIRKLGSLKNKKIVILILSLILVTLSYFNIIISHNKAIDTIEAENKKTLEGVIYSLQNFFGERKTDFAVTSSAIKDHKANPEIPIQSLVGSSGTYKSMSYVDSSGKYVCTSDKNYDIKNANIINDYGENIGKYLTKANMSKAFVISDFFKTKSGDIVIAVIQPIIDEKGSIDDLVGIIDSQTIGSKIIYANFLNSNNTIFGVDKNLTRIFSLGSRYIGKGVLEDKSTLPNNTSKVNYEMMSKGKPIVGVHYSVFVPGNPNEIMSSGTKRYIVSLPVFLENEFKFSLAITTPASVARYMDLFILSQIILFILLGIVMAYFAYLLFNDYKENQKLQQSLFESRENEKQMIEFFCNMSHELRTPLTIILSGIHFIYKRCETSISQSSDLNKTLAKIKHNAFRLLKIVNNILEISRLDHGLISAKLVNMDIVTVIHEITTSAAPYAQQKDINLIFESDFDEKVVAVSEDGIEKIVLNILSNALKFTSKGGNILVKVSQDSNQIKISIKDDGIGIPKDKKQYIFERFTQVNSSLRRVAEGSGIGLSIVKSIAELYKWKLDVISEEGKGSEFILYLPDQLTEDNELGNEGIDKDINSAANIEFSDI